MGEDRYGLQGLVYVALLFSSYYWIVVHLLGNKKRPADASWAGCCPC